MMKTWKYKGTKLAEECSTCKGSGTTGRVFRKGYAEYTEDCPDCHKGVVFTEPGEELVSFINMVNKKVRGTYEA